MDRAGMSLRVCWKMQLLAWTALQEVEYDRRNHIT